AHARRGIRGSRDGETGGLTPTRTELIPAATLSGRWGPPQLTRGSPVDFTVELPLGKVAAAFDALNLIISTHNSKTEGFSSAKTQARDAIEQHHLRSVKTEVEAVDALIELERAAVAKETDGSEDGQVLSLAGLQASIVEKKSQISNAHKAGEKLTELLHTFLGRNDLKFTSTTEGYRILRNGKSIKHLSEGERTAIAFIYFIVQLADQDFVAAEGIIVIDDPISSLDSSSMYQAFAFLKNAVADAKQVFLLTHNFGFLRLLLNWLDNIPGKKTLRQNYMIVCQTTASSRSSRITVLDKTLQDYPTEYHYLFKVLATFQSEGTIASCYHIPNVVRKVLETFLDFHDPVKRSLYNKVQRANFDANKKAAIYKVANDLSHFTGQGFEPGLVPETQKTAVYTLELIAALAPDHHAGMMAAITA
ncbi:AAA family ATPase, partial [Roseomonas sp. ACRSG]|nr:AAA family ATPase [Roseomonas sp. ACRSG]